MALLPAAAVGATQERKRGQGPLDFAARPAFAAVGNFLDTTFGPDEEREERLRIREEIRARQPSSFRGEQQRLAGLMQERALGRGLFTPELQRMQQGQNLAQQRSLAAAAPRGQGALSSRLAAQNAARINQQGALQGLLASLRERQQAENALAGLLGEGRSLDIQRDIGRDAALARLFASQSQQDRNLGLISGGAKLLFGGGAG